MNMTRKFDITCSDPQADSHAISPTVKIVAMISLVVYAALELFFTKLSTHPIGLAAPCILILFGIWRIDTEKDRFQRMRLIAIISTYTFFWMIVPLGFKLQVPAIGGQEYAFPAIHAVGSFMFFLYFLLVLLFGKRIDCGWCCPCVTARETIGYPFRDKTPRTQLWWRLRWLKFALLGLLVLYLGCMIQDVNTSYDRAGKLYYDIITYGYYISFLLIPFTGNRNFCRLLCPYAALWGTLSFAGLFRIKAKQDLCTGCKKCESVCDMGIPIADMVRNKGEVRTIECMGCNRCVGVCPQNVLASDSFLEASIRWCRSLREKKA
jgi:glutamate synthase (NADPH) small chain